MTSKYLCCVKGRNKSSQKQFFFEFFKFYTEDEEKIEIIEVSIPIEMEMCIGKIIKFQRKFSIYPILRGEKLMNH